MAAKWFRCILQGGGVGIGERTLVKFDDVTEDAVNYPRGNRNVGHLTH